jgi:transketolase
MKPEYCTQQLQQIAAQIRLNAIESVHYAKSGHLGASLSCADMLTALYFGGMNLGTPETPDMKQRDAFILSKGHAAPGLYATLAERGLLNKQLLPTLRQINSPLQGHPESHRLEYVDCTTGSLGQGLSVGVGIAHSKKLFQGKDANRVYVILGDGEMQEGQNYEAAMAAPRYGLDNLVCFIDHNKYQIGGTVDRVLRTDAMAGIFRLLSWNVYEIDGHNMSEINEAIRTAKEPSGKPTMIIAHTQKGNGVSFMAGNAEWHGKVPDAAALERAREELLPVIGDYRGGRNE